MNPWFLWCFLAALFGLAVGVSIGIRQRRARDAVSLRNCWIEIERRGGISPLDDLQTRNRFEEQCG
jgi:hypothetical protein